MEEASALFTALDDTQIEAEELETLVRKTEGWIAGLKLARLTAKRHGDRKRFIDRFSGREKFVAEFFAEDVFGRQLDDVREFLLKTSVFDRITAPLCDKIVKRGDSATVLRHLDDVGLFVELLPE